MKKRKKLVSGERFYFIYPSEVSSEIMKIDSNIIDINYPGLVLTIGDAESCNPEIDSESNCFRTKAEAKKALMQIKKILKYRG